MDAREEGSPGDENGRLGNSVSEPWRLLLPPGLSCPSCAIQPFFVGCLLSSGALLGVRRLARPLGARFSEGTAIKQGTTELHRAEMPVAWFLPLTAALAFKGVNMETAFA